MNSEIVVRQLTRSVRENSREFVLRYELAVRHAVDGTHSRRYVFRATVTEPSTRFPSEDSCELELPANWEDKGERLFDMITGAESPVFPVHVPEIVRDELAATALDEDFILLPSASDSERASW